MKDELGQLLSEVLLFCASKAKEEPDPKCPPSAEIEQALDEWFRRLGRGGKLRKPTKAMALAMLPRVRVALLLRSAAESHFGLLARADEIEVDSVAMLEFLLVTFWHETGKALWLSGKLRAP